MQSFIPALRHLVRRYVRGALTLVVLTVAALHAGQARAEQPMGNLDDMVEAPASQGAQPWPLPAGVHMLRDVSYGPDPLQRMDVYLPAHTQGAAVLFMVHGGAWRHGDKAMERVVRNKVQRWVAHAGAQAMVLVSINYRMLPQAGPLTQVQDVARALARAQQLAPQWGADARRFFVMGHSAGAHLVALLAASPALQQAQGVQPVLATLALDSAALDVPQLMRLPHLRLYDAAFGSDPAQWALASPVQQLQQAAAPLLAVCSSRRRIACSQAERMAQQGRALGMRVQVLPVDLTHRQTNENLGLDGAYTDAVQAFMQSVDTRGQ